MQRFSTIIEIIRMRQQEMPYQVCESRLGVSSSVVTYVTRRFQELHRSLEELENLDPNEVEELFYPNLRRRHKKVDLPDFESMYERFVAKDSKVTVNLLWLEYKEAEPDGYGYTQFLKYFKEYVCEAHGPTKLKMIVNRNPGEKMYVDWMGDQPELLLDPQTGELTKLHFFCSTIGVSSDIYAEPFLNEKLESFIAGNVNALNYYGAVPRFLIPDNLRAAVTKHTKDELQLTAACRDMEKHYGFIITPPPPRRPKGKASVENLVGFAERRLVETLKQQSPFNTLGDVKDATRAIIDEMNTRLERGRAMTRHEMFKKYDLPKMCPLPAEPFALWDYQAVSKIPADYHITYDGHKYSVPYTLAGKPVMIKASISDIIITDENNRIVARHKRSYREFPKAVTDPQHMPSHHRFYDDVAEMDGQKYRTWAERIGPNTMDMVERILSSAEYEEQMYESCTRLMYHAKDVPAAIVEAAADACLTAKKCSCTQFRKMITEKMNAPNEEKADHVQPHDNIRGKEYFT